MRVETDDGSTTYGSSSSAGKTVLARGTGMKNLTGIMFFSFGNYKLVPRTNADIALGAVSIEEDVISEQFDITPHPVRTTAQIQCEINTVHQPILKIMNLSGQELHTIETIKLQGALHSAIIPSGLPAGMYMFKMIGDAEIKTGTFIVQP
jgi:hypothetical protein